MAKPQNTFPSFTAHTIQNCLNKCKGAFSNLLEEMSMYFGTNPETDVKVKLCCTDSV